MPGVFLSYNHKDRHFVQWLADRLRQHNIRVWLDEGELLIGDSLVEKISAAIHGIDFVVAILSRNSVSSSWVQTELEWAMSREIAGKVVRVLPVRLDDCPLPSYLCHKMWGDFTQPARYEDTCALLVRSILARRDVLHSGPRGEPDPTPSVASVDWPSGHTGRKDGWRTGHDITVYALSTCSWCRKTMALLDGLGFGYEWIYVDMAVGDMREQLVDVVRGLNPRCSYPTLCIDGDVVVGFDEREIKRLLKH
jgi:glutaredoxin